MYMQSSLRGSKGTAFSVLYMHFVHYTKAVFTVLGILSNKTKIIPSFLLVLKHKCIQFAKLRDERFYYAHMAVFQFIPDCKPILKGDTGHTFSPRCHGLLQHLLHILTQSIGKRLCVTQT